MSDKNTAIDARSIAYGSIYLATQSLLSTFIGVIGYTFLTRRISQAEIGAIAGLTLIASLFQLLSDFGFASSLAKFVSELRGRNEDVTGYLVSALFFRILPASLFSFILLFFSQDISSILFKTSLYSSPVRILSLDILLISFVPLLSNFLLGIGKLKQIAYYGLISASIRWSAIIIFLLYGLGVTGVVMGWIVGDSLAIIMYLTSAIRMKFLRRIHPDPAILSKMLRFSYPLYFASLISFLYSYYDQATILALLPLSDLGIYNVAFMVYNVLIGLSATLSSALFPYYGMAYGREDHQAVSSAIARASKYSALIFAPLAFGLFATSNAVITLFAGQQYGTGSTVLSILSLFAAVYSISPAFSNLLLIYGKTKTILLLNLLSIAVSLLMLPLLLYLGLNGLAIMKGLSLLLTFILSVSVLSRVVKISIDKYALSKIFSCCVIMTITVILVEQLYYSRYMLPFYVFIGGLVYVLLLRFLRVINDQDLIFLRQSFGDKIGSLLLKVFHT